MARKDVVALHLTVVLRRCAGDDNGPAQEVEAVRQAALEQLDGSLLEVSEEGNPRRGTADYELTVADAQLATAKEARQAYEKLGEAFADTVARPYRK